MISFQASSGSSVDKGRRGEVVEGVANGACTFAGLGGGRSGEEGVAGRMPADAGEGQLADQESGLLDRFPCTGARTVGVAPVDAGLPEGTEGDRVATGLGGEVVAEAEHVRPPPQPGIPQPFRCPLPRAPVRVVVGGRVSEFPAGVDEVGDVVPAGDDLGHRLRREPGGGVAGGLGGLGRVLGQVACDLLVGQPGRVAGDVGVADGPQIDLFAPRDEPPDHHGEAGAGLEVPDRRRGGAPHGAGAALRQLDGDGLLRDVICPLSVSAVRCPLSVSAVRCPLSAVLMR
jgi:hypothetical protein